MRIVSKILILVISIISFSLAVEDKTLTELGMEELDKTIKMIKDNQETRKELKDTQNNLNHQIKEILVEFTGKKPRLVFELPDGKKVLYGVNKFGHPYSMPVKNYSQVEEKLKVNATTDVDKVKTKLPIYSLIVAGFIYMFTTIYFLYMTFWNAIRHNFFIAGIDFLIWIVSTSIIWLMFEKIRDTI